MFWTIATTALIGAASCVSAQEVASDPGRRGPPLETVHLYNDQWPVGIAVTKTNRLFSTYPLSLDSNNTRYQVAELTSNTTEVPYPNAEINTPPGGAINTTTYPHTGVNYDNYFISVQACAVDPLERLWCLDNGRPLSPNGTLLEASFGGPKLVAINTTSNKVVDTIVFPPTVAYPDSYLNDVRIDLHPNLSDSTGLGIAYITDSSNEGRSGLIIADIGSKTAWRHLDSSMFVRPTQGHFKQVWGEPVYRIPSPGEPYGYDNTGVDGLGFTGDGETLYFSVTGSRYLYSIPTAALRKQGPSSEVLAQAAVTNHGQKGCSDGLMQDSNNYIYAGSFEDNAINVYNPGNGSTTTYVRDPRIGWTDSMWVSSDNYLYFTENQLWRTPSYYPGTDRRVKPFALFRVPTADNGTRVAPK